MLTSGSLSYQVTPDIGTRAAKIDPARYVLTTCSVPKEMKRNVNGTLKIADTVTDTKNWLFRLGQPYFIRWDYDPRTDTYVTEVTSTMAIGSYDNHCCLDNKRLVEQVLWRAGIYPRTGGGCRIGTSWYTVKDDTKKTTYNVRVAHNDEKKIKRN